MQVSTNKEYSKLSRGELQLIHIREYFLNTDGCIVIARYFAKNPCYCNPRHPFYSSVFEKIHLKHCFHTFNKKNYWTYDHKILCYEFSCNYHEYLEDLYYRA